MESSTATQISKLRLVDVYWNLENSTKTEGISSHFLV